MEEFARRMSPTQNLLIAEAIRMAKDLKVHHIEFRQENSLNNGFHEKTSKVSMRLDLPGSSDELWKSFPSKLRSQIKVPQKAGMIARIGRDRGTGKLLRGFFRKHEILGTPVYPKRFFRNILEEFPTNTWICSVYMGNTPVASGFLAGFKNRLEIPWASSVRKLQSLKPEHAALLVLPEIRLRERVYNIRFWQVNERGEHLQIQGAVGSDTQSHGMELLGSG